MDKLEIEHRLRLDQIVGDFKGIKEQYFDIRWIIRESFYRQKGEFTPFPDLILVRDKSAVPIEYKHSPLHKEHAMEQLQGGVEFIERELNLNCEYARFVFYSQGSQRFVSEKILRGAFT